MLHYAQIVLGNAAMRHLITFIVRLWVDAQTEPPAWEGQVECVGDGAHEYIRAPDELLAFIDAHTITPTEQPTIADRQPIPKA